MYHHQICDTMHSDRELSYLSLAVPAKSDREYVTENSGRPGNVWTNQKAALGQKVNFPVNRNLSDQWEGWKFGPPVFVSFPGRPGNMVANHKAELGQKYTFPVNMNVSNQSEGSVIFPGWPGKLVANQKAAPS